MADLYKIMSYLQQSTRNRIVFCHDDIDGVDFVDVGKEMALLLVGRQQNNTGLDAIYKLVLNKSRQCDSIGMYLAIENIGILFEPELKLDLRSLFNHYSKNQCLIVRTEAKIENDTLYFLDTSDNASINLQGLSYTII